MPQRERKNIIFRGQGVHDSATAEKGFRSKNGKVRFFTGEGVEANVGKTRKNDLNNFSVHRKPKQFREHL